MRYPHEVGDLVHIPQSVALIDCNLSSADDPQLTIPLRVLQTKAPKLGVITGTSSSGYVHIYCEGDVWAVKYNSIYKIDKDMQ